MLDLSEAKGPDGRSVLFDASMMALPGAMEQRIFLGHEGRAGNESIEAAVSFSPPAAQRAFFPSGVEVFLANNLGLGR